MEKTKKKDPYCFATTCQNTDQICNELKSTPHSSNMHGQHGYHEVDDPSDNEHSYEKSNAPQQRPNLGQRKPVSSMKKAPDAPKRFKSAFIFFSAEKHKEIRTQLGDQGVGEKTPTISKMVSKAWRDLAPQEKLKWEAMALTDKMRYEVEKTLYRGPWQVPRRRTPKDSRASKRPMSAFLAFANSRRASMKQRMPDARNGEISKALAAIWKESSDELRQPYFEEERMKRKAYKVAMAIWREKDDARKRLVRQRREQKALRIAENMGADSGDDTGPNCSKGHCEKGEFEYDDVSECDVRVAAGRKMNVAKTDRFTTVTYPMIAPEGREDGWEGRQESVASFGAPYSAGTVFPSNPHEYSHPYGPGDASRTACQQPAYSTAPGYWLHDGFEQSRQQRLDYNCGGNPRGYPYPERFTSYHHQTAATSYQWSGHPSLDGEQPPATNIPWTIPSYHCSSDPR